MKGTFGGEESGESSKVSRAPTPPPANSRRLSPDFNCSAQGLTLCLRPDALLKARHSAQGKTFCSRPDALLKARHSAQGQTFCSRPDISA
ncbi:hypothetical protein M5K25_000783 [Dendrobium thyrsiflorum]|uniref:Uncharacterized protein n=1 Tax=Dendrobium thyrsiflorum TaxID=117978 RepID=A0ABD0W6Q1_DENTH